MGEPGRALLAFDFDGVLSPIVDDPEQAQPFPGALPALANIGRFAGSVAIITGRQVPFVISRNGFDVLSKIPGFTIFGQYGAERWDSASRKMTARPPHHAVAAARVELRRLLQRLALPRGFWLEDKGRALAVHTRRAADPDGALAMLSEPMDDLARRHDLKVEPGKMVLEIRPPDVDKGQVLRAYAQERAARSVLYAGDDKGDLSAFAVIDELRNLGVPGIKVCSRSPEAPEVAEAADLVVDGPAGITELLRDLCRRMGGGCGHPGRDGP
jgi:trehalose 6-phosphate phosphatase